MDNHGSDSGKTASEGRLHQIRISDQAIMGVIQDLLHQNVCQIPPHWLQRLSHTKRERKVKITKNMSHIVTL